MNSLKRVAFPVCVSLLLALSQSACGDPIDLDALEGEPISPQPSSDVRADASDASDDEDPRQRDPRPDRDTAQPEDDADDSTDDADDDSRTEPDLDVDDSDSGRDDASQPDTDPSEDTDTSQPGPDVPPSDPDVVPEDALDSFPSGAFRVRETEGSASGVNGNTVPLVVYTPIRSGSERFPLIVFSPGYQYEYSDYKTLGSFLASYGFVVVIPTWSSSFPFHRSDSDLADDVVEMITWLSGRNDNNQSVMYRMIDMSWVGVGGHSRGGKQSILASIRDSRIKATFNFEPVDTNPQSFVGGGEGISVTPELMGDLTIPAGFIGTGKGGQVARGSAQACAPEAENYHQYYLHTAGPAWEYLIPNAATNDFSETCHSRQLNMRCNGCGRGDEQSFNVRLARRVMAAFFILHLKGDDSYREWIDGDEIYGLRPWVTFERRNH